MQYLVSWVIDIEADSPYDAACKAREIQLDPESHATYFEVVGAGSGFGSEIDVVEGPIPVRTWLVQGRER